MKLSENPILRRVFSLAVTFAMLLSMLVVMPVSVSADENQPGGGKSLELLDADIIPDLRNPENLAPSDNGIMTVSLDEEEYVRVSIVVEGSATISAGFDAKNIADNDAAMSYRAELELQQEDVAARIRSYGIDIDVVWNLTLVANIISANVRRGDIEAIKTVPGVVDVYEETVYTADSLSDPITPSMANSPALTGSPVAWSSGYTGAGSRIAIIDTGIDLEHIAFDADALLYSYQKNGYDTSLLMTADEVAEVYPKLNMSKRGSFTADMYYSEKIPVAFNYADGTSNARHLGNGVDFHGSHVAGIAAANAYIPDGNGGFTDVTTVEEEQARVKGVAPDAQLFAMQVFTGGTTSESDYFAAMEDAILLGADVCNLSLGSTNGFSHSDRFGEVLEEITESGVIVAVMAQGNDGAFPDGTYPGALYNDDVSFNLTGSPASFTDSIAVASVNNSGYVEQIVLVNGDEPITVYDAVVEGNSSNDDIQPFYSLGDNVEFFYLDSVGTKEEFDYLAEKGFVQGKVVCVNRGDIDFSTKANNAVEAGAIGVIIVNSYSDSDPNGGTIRMDLSAYKYTAPVVSVSHGDGYVLSADLSWQYEEYGDNGDWIYYYLPMEGETATLDITIHGALYDEKIMSDFSSWGVPGSLELKPDITAPGGYWIYSVLGANDNPNGGEFATNEHDQYAGVVGTSQAAPHISGMIAVLSQYIQKTGLADKLGLAPRVVAQSLLMSTATPIMDPYNSGYYYPVLYQGAGLANIGNAVSADAFIMMAPNANNSYDDGKVKVELGDDPLKTGVYDYTFTLTNTGEGTNSYTFNTDLFTQAIEGAYLSKYTAPIPSSVSYKVNNEPYEVVASIDADVDMDGDTDEYDAVAILDYLVGNVDGSKLDLIAADVDSDTEVTSYDAHLILAGLGTRVTLKPGETVTVDVHIELNKAALESYVNGAWVEGYTTVSAEASAEGVLDVDYSIPIIGFYGNWTDPSMFDRQTDIDAIYGTNDLDNYGDAEVRLASGDYLPYNGLLTYVDSTDGGEYIVTGNNYVTESEFPADRLAIRSSDTIGSFNYTLIRSASDVLTMIYDGGGNVVWGAVDSDVRGMYVNEQGSVANDYEEQVINVSPADVELAEGDKFTVSLTAIPEYYLMNAEHDVSAVLGVVTSGILGKGATLSYTFTVDDTAPVITGANLSVDLDDPDAKSDLSFSVTDNENLAFVAVCRRSNENFVFAYDVPATDEFTFTATAEELEGAGEFVLLYAADYAGNTTVKMVRYGGESADLSGTLVGVDTNTLMWSKYEPDIIGYDYNTSDFVGITPIAPANSDADSLPVSAATYADGYLFLVGLNSDGTTGALYAASVDEPDYVYQVCDLPSYGIDAVTALSTYNGSIIVMNSAAEYSELYMVDLVSGGVGPIGVVTNDEELPFNSMAITPDGTCYGDVYGNAFETQGRLYEWDILEANLYYSYGYPMPATAIETVGKTEHIPFISLAYDEASRKVYCSGFMNFFFPAVYMYAFDVDTYELDYSNVSDTSSFSAAEIPVTYALTVIPEDTESVNLRPTTTATGIPAPAEINLLVGENYPLNIKADPWMLEITGDDGLPVSTREVRWVSNDPTTVMVNGNVLYGVKEGTATIVGTSVATPSVTTGPITVNVTTAPAHDFTAFVYGADGTAGWVQVNASSPKDYIPLTSSDYDVYAGTASGELEDGSQKIFVQTGAAIAEIDPVTLQPDGRSTVIEYINFLFSDMADVPYPIGTILPQPDEVNPTEFLAIGDMGDSLYFGNIDTLASAPYYFNGFSSKFGSPMVGITYQYNASLSGSDSIIAVYAVMCEDGGLHQVFLGLTGEYAGYILIGAAEYDTGIKNPGAGDFYTANKNSLNALGSLYFSEGADPQSSADDFLLYAVYNTSINPDTALLYYIKTDSRTGEAHISVDPEGFGLDVWPVTALIGNSAVAYDPSGASAGRVVEDAIVIGTPTVKSLGECVAVTEPVAPMRRSVFANVFPATPAPVEPAPAEPTPEEPAPTEPTPTEPAPAEPAPAEPAPAESAPEEPADNVTASVVGSLNSITAEGSSTAKNSQYVDPKNCTVMVQMKITDDTNGLFTVKYDPTMLTLVKATPLAAYCSMKVDEAAGTITFAYASAESENGMVLDLLFSYDKKDAYKKFNPIEINMSEENDSESAHDSVSIPIDPDTANGVHVHNFVMAFSATEHWLICPSCGVVGGAREPHTFVNGVCTACGYVQPGYALPAVPGGTAETPIESSDDTVEIESPVEGSFNNSVAEG